MEAQWEAELDSLGPQDRFERVEGLPATPEPGSELSGCVPGVASEVAAADGGATWSMSGPADDLVAFDEGLTKAAIACKLGGDERTVTQLKYDIARDLAVEGLQHSAARCTARRRICAGG